MRAAAFLLIGLGAAAALAADGPTVAILPLDAPAEPAGSNAAAAARDVIAATLAAPGGPKLVTREALDRVLDEGKLTRIGKLLGATRAVKGTLFRTPAGWRAVLVVLEVPSGAVLGSGRGSLEAAAGAVRRLLAAEAPPADLREDPNALASLHYLRGLGFHRAGLHLEAIGELLEARRLAVRFPETRYWTARSYLAEGEPRHAAIEARAFLAAAPDHPLAAAARTLVEETATAETPRRIEPPAPKDRAMEIARTVAASDDVAENSRLLEELHRMGAPALADLARRDRELWLRVLYRILPYSHTGFRDPFCAALDDAARDRLLEKLASPLAADRELAVHVLALTDYRLAGDQREAVRRAEITAARHEGPGVSLSALRLLVRVGEKRAETLAHERCAASGTSDAWRIEAVRVFGPRAGEAMGDVLVGLLDSESRAVRADARVLMCQGPARDALFEECWRLLRARKHPEEAYDLARVSRVPRTAETADFGRTLLASWEPSERAAGLFLVCALREPDARETAWRHCEDDAAVVRSVAVGEISKLGRAEGDFERLLGLWKTFVRPEYEYPGGHLDAGTYLTVLKMLSGRRETRVAPAPSFEDGPEAFRLWRDGRWPK